MSCIVEMGVHGDQVTINETLGGQTSVHGWYNSLGDNYNRPIIVVPGNGDNIVWVQLV